MRCREWGALFQLRLGLVALGGILVLADKQLTL